MKLPKNDKTDFEIAPAANHVACCFKLIDLGTQKVEWQGTEKLQRKVLIGWELTNEMMADGRPFVISNRYTFSTYERAKFRQHLESWRGKAFDDEKDFGNDGAFDAKNLLGVGCLLNVVHAKSKDGSKTYANVAGIAPIPKGTTPPVPINDQIYFSLDEPDQDVYDSLPDWVQEVISKSPEFEALTQPVTDEKAAEPTTTETPAPPDDEIPF